MLIDFVSPNEAMRFPDESYQPCPPRDTCWLELLLVAPVEFVLYVIVYDLLDEAKVADADEL